MLHRLDNGLDVILERNAAAPVVALQAWVQVGSADESEREAGLAHLHEHMLFKGTKRRGPGEVARDIEARGGEVNAWTSFDQTVYHLTIASRFFEEGLDVLSDAVLHSVFDADELSREIEVVLEEIKRANDMPTRRASREMFALSYDRHPYRRPVIGWPETVRSFTRDDVLSFYRRHYTPDNICLVVVGDFNPEVALSRIDALWGGARGEHGGRPERPGEERRSAPRAKVVKDNVKEAHLAFSWAIPDIRSDDLVALDLASAVLGNGDNARLVQEIKRERQLASAAHAYAYTPKDPGLFVLGATLPEEKVEAAVPALLEQVQRLREELVGDRELEVAKRLMESEAIWQRETVQGVARKLGFYHTVAGSLDFERNYYERLRACTAEQIREACGRWLDDRGVHAVAVGGEDFALAEDRMHSLLSAPRPARAEARTEGAERPIATQEATPVRRIGAKQEREGILRHVLPSGVRVLVKPERGVPVVAARAAWKGGLRFESDEVSGIHHLLARSITKGTRRRSARELAALSDELVCSLGGSGGRNSFGLRGDWLSKNFEASFRLFAECLREPAFSDVEVEKDRALQLEEIRTREDSPSGVVFDLFSQALYREHPYRLDPIGERDPVTKLSGADLRDWMERHYGGENLVLTLTGDVDPDAAFTLAEDLFGDMPAARGPLPSPGVEAPPDSQRRSERRMDKQQAHLLLGFSGARFTDPHRHALEVLASVLAGQGGRLFVELRDKRSMAYSVTAFNLEGVDPGYFAVYMGTSPEKLDDAIAGIRAELEKVVRESITEEELQRARRYLVGSHAIGLQKGSSRAAVIALDEAYGLGADHFVGYRQRIESVTREQVLEAARRHIDLDRSVLAIVSPTAG